MKPAIVFAIVFAWILWALQTISTCVSRFLWFKRDFPDAELPTSPTPDPTCVSRFTKLKHLHIVAIVAFLLIIAEAFLLAMAAGHAIFVELGIASSRLSRHDSEVDAVLSSLLQGVAIVMMIIIVQIVGSKQLIMRIVGEKGTTVACDYYDCFLCAMGEPLIVNAVLTGIYVLVNSTALNYALSVQLDSKTEDWQWEVRDNAFMLRTLALTFLIVSWVGTAVLFVCNLVAWRGASGDTEKTVLQAPLENP